MMSMRNERLTRSSRRRENNTLPIAIFSLSIQLKKRNRGHPIVSPDRLFLKALVIIIVRHYIT